VRLGDKIWSFYSQSCGVSGLHFIGGWGLANATPLTIKTPAKQTIKIAFITTSIIIFAKMPKI
jgi:hypothetical protein